MAAVLAAALAATLLLGAATRRDASQAAFLERALGEPAPTAASSRRADAETAVRLRPGGYDLQRGDVAVGLRSLDAPAGAVEAHANGISRRTPYGFEVVTVGSGRTEQFLTVTERQGRKTWRWQLATLDSYPRVGADGAVAFIRGGRLLSDVAYIEPVRILDGAGADVTPAAARWSLAEDGARWFLELELDDAGLPLPYVIDPAISNRSVGVSTPDGASANEVIPVPAGVAAGDVLIAQLTMRGNTTITGVTGQPSGGGAFTSIDRQVSGTTLSQEVLYRVATASEPATSYTFALSASVKASAGIAAYVDGANQANPIDASAGQVNASGTTATAPGATTTVADTRLLTLVGSATGNGGTTNWTGLATELWDTSSSGGGPGSRTSTGLGDEAVAATGATGTRTATNAGSAITIGQSVAIAPLAADGSGTLTTPTANVAASSAGNTLTFTYTVATGGMRDGSVTLAVPTGWNAPSTTGADAGFTTASSGTVGVAGQTITVSGLTLTAGSTFTITYGSKASSGPGATAAATTGAQTWQAQQRSSSTSGALANLGASPSVAVNAADGSGTSSVSPTTVSPGTAATLTFTYTAATGGMNDGAVTILFPAAWTAPNTSSGTPGFSTATGGSGTNAIAWNSGTRVLTISGVTLAGGGTLTIAYGTGAGGAVTVPSGTGSQTWTTQQRSVSGSTLTALGASPSTTFNSPPTATVSLSPAAPTTGQTLTATATKSDADGDPVTLTYVWKVNGTTVKTTSGSASLTDTLDLSLAGNGDRGDSVSVEVTPNDGVLNGSMVSSAETVANSAPTISTVTIDQGSPLTNDTLTVTVSSADPDGDARTLSYQWAKNGTDLTGETAATLNLATAGNGNKTDTITVRVTANDGTANSAPTTSAAVTIANSAPTINTVTIDQTSPLTNDTLTVTVSSADPDGDARTYTYQWVKNGVDRFAETAATYDLSVLGNGDKGDAITVRVTASDGAASSAPTTSAGATVANSAPVLSTVAIDQAAPATDDTLTATIGATDPDGDALTPTRQWRKNGVDLTGETAATLNLATAGNGNKTDTIALRVSVSDGTASAGPLTSAAVTVANSAPTISTVTIDQLSPQTNDTLTVSVVSADADGDARTYTYQWAKNGTDLTGETAPTLNLATAGNGSKGDSITVRVTASDGTASSAPTTSAGRTVANTAPAATVALTPATPGTNDLLTATATKTDADGDTVTLTYVWKVNGTTIKTTSGSASLTDTLDLAQAGNGDKGQTVSVEVTPNDGTANGNTVSSSVTVANSAPSASASLSPAAPKTDELVTATATKTDADGDTVTLTYVWKVNGTTVKTTTATPSLTDTLDLAQAGNGDKGQTITVEITPDDGTANGTLVTDSTTVANTAPTINTVTIDQTSPLTNDTLTVSVSSGDPDGDALTLTYQWAKNGVDLTGETAATLDLSTLGKGDKGDTITIRVTAGDGTASSAPTTSSAVTIANSAPVLATVAIDQASARTADTLTSTVTATDPDGDAVTTSRQWTKGGVDLTGETGASLDLSLPGNGDRGDVLRVRAGASDGSAAAVPVDSAPLTVGNTAPTATVALAPSSPATDDVLTATATKADVDGDAVTLTFVWKVNGTTVKTTSNSTSLTDTLDLSLAGNGNAGDTVSVEATPSDGTASGAAASAAVVVDLVADRLAFTSSTADLGSGTQRTLTVEVRDADGALVSDDNTTQVALAQTAGSGTVTGLGTATASAGVASLVVDGALAGPVTITATSAGLTSGATTFSVVHGTSTQITLGESGSTASGDTHTLTATLRDAAGNVATGDSSTVVAFAKTGGSGTVTGTGNATASNGVATLAVTNSVAGSITLGATATGLTSGSATYTITPGAASTTTSTITAAPASIVANGTSTITITVRLKDAVGNDLTGSGGTVTLSRTGTGTLSSVTDNGDGTYTATLTAPTTVGSATVSGELNAVALVATASVAYAHGTATQLALTETGSTTAGNAHTLTATVQDANGNTVTGDSSTVVTFAKTGGAGTVDGLGSATASAGVATLTVTNRLAGQVDLQATATGLSAGTASYTVVVGPVSAGGSIVTAAPASVQNNGTDASTITVTVLDAAGNPLPGKTVTLDDAGAASVISPASTATNASGVATFTATSTAVETAVYTATADSVVVTDTATVDYVFNDTTAPTNAITLASAAGAYLSGTTLWYRPSAAGSFTLSSAVSDTGSGPGSASYPSVTQSGWTHALETVSTPAGGPYVSSSYSWTTAASSDFAHVVTAADAWSPPNTSTTTLNVTEDSTAPAAAIQCNGAACSAGWYTSSPVSVGLAAPDAGAGLDQIRYTTDGTDPTFASGTVYSGAFAVAAEGVTTVKYRAFDRIGNDSGVQSQTIRIDTIAPQTTLDSTPAAATQDTTPTFAFSSNEAGSTFEYRLLPGGSWTSSASPVTLGPLAEGTYTFEARATDGALNVDGSPASFVFTVDTTPADTTITASPAAATNATSATFSFTATDAGPSFECSLDGGAFAPCTSSQTYSGLAEGAHTFAVRAKDAAGNLDPSPATFAWTVDTTAPQTTIDSQPANPASSTGATFAFSSSEGGSSFECRLDAGAWAPCTSPHNLTGLADGPHTFDVRATDPAGNTDPTPATFTWTVDTTDPALTVSAPDVNLASPNPETITAVATDGGSGVASVNFEQCSAANDATCSVDTWTPLGLDTTSPYSASWPIPSDGTRLIRVRATDNAGRQTTVLDLVTVDRIRPTGTVTSPLAGANLRGTSVPMTASASDTAPGTVNTVTFQSSPAGAGTWSAGTTDSTAPYAAALDTTALADGLYDLRVFTTDAAGNAETTPATVTVRVDNTAPTGNVTFPAASANVRQTITLTSDSADPLVNGSASGVATVAFQRSPAGASTWTSQGAAFDTTTVADGLYDLRLVTTDAAGNTSTSTAVTIRVDNTAPTGNVTAPAAGAEIGVPPATLTSDSADAGSGVATVVFERSPAGANTWTATATPWDTASGPDSVSDGDYDLRVTTTDNAGNSFTSAAVTVKVDHTAPTTTATLSPGSPSNVPVTIVLSASDGSGSGVDVTQCYVDGVLDPGCTVEAPGDNSNDGSHLVEYFSTDAVGNVEATKSVTVVIDTTAPSGSPGDPGDYLRGIARLTYTTSDADVASVQFQFSPAGMATWTNIGGLDLAAPYEVDWNTDGGSVSDGPYDLRVVVTDAVGNAQEADLPGLPKTVDNTEPVTSVTAPGAATFQAGTFDVTASASDGAAPASGIATVRFEIKASGQSSFTPFGTQTSPVVGSTYRQSLSTAGAYNDGPAELRAVATDVAGNETISATRTITIDNDAPVVAFDDPGANVGSTVNLSASSSADTVSVAFRYRTVGSGGAGTLIATDTTAPYSVTWSTSPTAEQQWELIAVATDGGGNVTTSAPRTVLVDRTLPSGSLTAPTSGQTVGGPAVALAASGADSPGSGVASAAFEVKTFGSGSYVPVGSDASAPYSVTWDSTSAPDGATEIRAVITDNAGNVRTTSAVPVTLDSTGPSVSLADPGAVLSGTVNLSATTGGGAVRVSFGVSSSGSGTWTEIASDTSSPFAAAFDTRALADGVYDLRATGYDSLGNPSTTPAVRASVRVDNIAPTLVSSSPADGAVSTSASQIVLTASEPVTAPGARLDGALVAAPAVAGNELTFATGALSDGLHVLSGELEDAGGTRTPFRIAITIQSTPTADPPPVERSITSTGTWTMTTPGGLVTVRMPESAWPTPPTPQDYILVLRVDAGPVAASGAAFASGTQLVEVTARWALAGTAVTDFRAPLELVFSNPGGGPVLPAFSSSGAGSWRVIAPLEGSTLPASQHDGFFRDGTNVHVLTRHLTFFGLLLDNESPTAPRDLAGVVAGDGLTLRWIPGTDASGQLGDVILYVNGEAYRRFGPTELEAKLGEFLPGDTRRFTLAQADAAGNLSAQTRPLRAVPALAGKSYAVAAAGLAAAGFAVGAVREETAPAGVAPGTVLQPTDLRLALEASAIDLVVARGANLVGRTRLAFSVVGAKALVLRKGTVLPARLKLSKPADMTATLYSGQRRLHSWKVRGKAGANIVKLRLPPRLRKPGTYRLTWVARSETETVPHALEVRLVGPKAAGARPKRDEIEVVVAAEPTADAPKPRVTQGGPRVVARTASPDETFDLAGSPAHEVGVVVADVDAYGISFVAELRAVFPSLRVIAISRDPARRALAIRAGAVLALPRTTTPAQLGKAIALVAGR